MSAIRPLATRARETAQYYAIRAGIAAMQAFPVDQNVRTLRAIGRLYATAPINRPRLQRAIDNLRWCFPQWDEATARRHAIDSYRRLFALATEVAYTQRLISDDGWAKRIHLGEMAAALRRLLLSRERGGGPLIFITGHCGNWELLGYTLGALGFPMHAVYRPLDLAPLDRWVRETRGRRGLLLLDKFGAMRDAPGILARGEHLAFLADQNAGPRGVFVPFFGRLASTYKSIGLLAMRFRTPIICGQARSVGRDATSMHPLDEQQFRYEIDATDIIDPSDWESQPDPLFYITARYRRAIETMVRRAPEQYLWMHRYWKARPAHEREGRSFPARLREKLLSLPWMTQDELARIEARSAVDAEAWRQAHAPGAAAPPEPEEAPEDEAGEAESGTLRE